MALGTPVVATSRGAEGIGARHGEEILIADTPPEFAEEVLRLMAEPDLRRRIAMEGRAFVEERFGWEAIAAQLGRTLASHATPTPNLQEPVCL